MAVSRLATTPELAAEWAAWCSEDGGHSDDGADGAAYTDEAAAATEQPAAAAACGGTPVTAAMNEWERQVAASRSYWSLPRSRFANGGCEVRRELRAAKWMLAYLQARPGQASPAAGARPVPPPAPGRSERCVGQ
eukprot:TRINITY_DN2579_c1_g1_i1.p2 TRINITY_DN2579_c1_g1~~TRINITY_DN2579_c1_g1_i1.p2  ORF type:complete len:152 (+),score=21.66 TRINITY_DN2579_c1_g1_i1:54-458(+)